jgi:hypothetical protein
MHRGIVYVASRVVYVCSVVKTNNLVSYLKAASSASLLGAMRLTRAHGRIAAGTRPPAHGRRAPLVRRFRCVCIRRLLEMRREYSSSYE